jgi:hypothetical protein
MLQLRHFCKHSVNTFSYLKSPIVKLVIGEGENAVLLYAHQALLARSPFFADAFQHFEENATSRRIEFLNEDLDAMGSFLQYMYTGEYYPKLRGVDSFEIDENIIGHEEGAHLLKHARIYTLADKLGVPVSCTVFKHRCLIANSITRD